MSAPNPLAGLFLDDEVGRSRGNQTFVRGFLSSWTLATGANVVTVDSVTYTNCSYLFGGELASGVSVLLAFVDPGTKPVILARLGSPV